MHFNLAQHVCVFFGGSQESVLWGLHQFKNKYFYTSYLYMCLEKKDIFVYIKKIFILLFEDEYFYTPYLFIYLVKSNLFMYLKKMHYFR